MDRLKLKPQSDSDSDDEGQAAMKIQMDQYAPIRSGMKQIEANTAQLRKLMQENKKITKPSEMKENANNQKRLMDATSATAQKVKASLDKIKQADEQEHDLLSKSHVEMRANLYNSSARAFHDIMSDYSDTCKESKKDLQDRTRRHLTISTGYKPAQIEEIMQDPERAQEIIKSAMVGDSVNLAREVSERHDQMMRLENSVLEVFEMFKDLSVLVDMQGEKLEIISSHVDDAKEAFLEGNKQLKEAEKHQKSSRNYKCYFLILLVVILLVVVIWLAGSGSFSSA